MSLPTLVTPGAVYVGAWRAQDAVVDGGNEVQVLPSVVGDAMIPRYEDGGVVYDGPSAAITRVVDGQLGPCLQIDGTASLWSEDATLLGACEGTTRFQSFARGRWAVGESYSCICGWEAWVANQVCYIECAAASTFLFQLDRGSGRRGFGNTAFNTNAWSVMQIGETGGDVNAYLNGSGTVNVTIDFDGEMSSGGWDAYIIGPMQRTAGGIWTYTNSLLWTRHVVVSTPTTALDPIDVANLNAWVEGADFNEPTYMGLFAMCP